MNWMKWFPTESLCHLSYSYSYHCPLLIQPNFRLEDSGPRVFKFKAWWTLEPSFEDEIQKVLESMGGDIFSKLEYLRVELRRWER